MKFRSRRGFHGVARRGRGYANAFYGVADYIALPIGMLLAAPFLLRHLGTAQYGVWILAGAAVSGGGIVSSSFGDAVIKYVGECRGRRDWSGITRIVGNMISINLLLSGILAIALWFLAPYVARHVVRVDLELQGICLRSLRIGSGLLLVKSIESVFISTLRAFETYGSTVRIAICSRIAILASAIVLAAFGRNVVWILVATLIISLSGTLAQALALRNKIGNFSPMPSWHRKTVSDIAAFGTFSWLQAIAGVGFSHADRFFVGFFMGAPAVAYYGLCVQAAQPIHGLISSGMHFLFPHLSARYSVAPISEIRHKIALAIRVNIALVCCSLLARCCLRQARSHNVDRGRLWPTAATHVSNHRHQFCFVRDEYYCALCSACLGTSENRDLSQSRCGSNHAIAHGPANSQTRFAGGSAGETCLRSNYLPRLSSVIPNYLANGAVHGCSSAREV